MDCHWCASDTSAGLTPRTSSSWRCVVVFDEEGVEVTTLLDTVCAFVPNKRTSSTVGQPVSTINNQEGLLLTHHVALSVNAFPTVCMYVDREQQRQDVLRQH